MNGLPIPRPDELAQYPELASITSLITQLEIVRRVLKASSADDDTRFGHRAQGIEVRAFNLILDLEDLIRFRHDPESSDL